MRETLNLQAPVIVSTQAFSTQRFSVVSRPPHRPCLPSPKVCYSYSTGTCNVTHLPYPPAVGASKRGWVHMRRQRCWQLQVIQKQSKALVNIWVSAVFPLVEVGNPAHTYSRKKKAIVAINSKATCGPIKYVDTILWSYPVFCFDRKQEGSLVFCIDRTFMDIN